MSNPLSLFGKDDYRTAVLPQEIPIRTRYGREPGAGRRIRRAWDLQGFTLKRDPGPNNYCEGRETELSAWSRPANDEGNQDPSLGSSHDGERQRAEFATPRQGYISGRTAEQRGQLDVAYEAYLSGEKKLLPKDRLLAKSELEPGATESKEKKSVNEDHGFVMVEKDVMIETKHTIEAEDEGELIDKDEANEAIEEDYVEVY